MDENAFSVQVLSSTNMKVSDPDANIWRHSSFQDENQVLDSTLLPLNTFPMDLQLMNAQLCQQVLAIGASSCSDTRSSDVQDSIPVEERIVQIVLDSVTKPVSAEVSVIAITYASVLQRENNYEEFSLNINDDKQMSHSAAIELAMRLTEALHHATWLSRRVIILLVPVDCVRSGECEVTSEMSIAATTEIRSKSASTITSNLPGGARRSAKLRHWLDQYTHRVGAYEGLLRDAFAVDLTNIRYTSRARDQSKGTEKLHSPHVLGIRPDSDKAGQYSLRVVGSGGALPNMDMVAAMLTLFPPPALRAYAGSTLPIWMVKILRCIIPGASIEGHLRRLQGLLSFWVAQLTGPDGLHGEFLAVDIDAISLRVESNTINIHALLDALLLTQRAFSQLHEELHHSHSFYYLMNGGAYFVGLGEMAFPLLLALLPLLQFFHSVTSRQPLIQLSMATRDALGDALPLALLLMAPSDRIVWPAGTGSSDHVAAQMLSTACAISGLRVLWLSRRSTKRAEMQSDARSESGSDGALAYSGVVSGALLILCMHAGGHFHALAHPLALLCAAALWTLYIIHGGEGNPLKASSRIVFVALAAAFNPLPWLMCPPSLFQIWLSDFTSKYSSGTLAYALCALHALSMAFLRTAFFA